MSFLWEPFQFPFMRTGLAAVVLAGVLCGLLGVYVVLRRISFVGHALTHSALPGLVWAHAHGVSLFLGAVAANLLTAVGIGWVSRREDVPEDTAIGLWSSAMFAGGLVMMARAKTFRDLPGLLFGQVLGVTPADVAWMAVTTGVVAVLLFLFHKEWMLAALDPGHARLIGLPVAFLRLGFLALLVLGVAVAVQTVGAVLAGALLVAPAAAARLVARRLPTMMALSALIGAGCGVGGLYLSYYTACPSGAAIVLLCAAVYGAIHLGTAWAAREDQGPGAVLAAALALNTLVLVVEAVGGWHAGSLALWVDVVHNGADEAGLFLLWWAYRRAGTPSPLLKKAGGLASGAGLLLLILLLAGMSARRLFSPVEVHGGLTLACGLFAMAGNAGVAWVLRGVAQRDPALRLAQLHNVGDSLLSLVPVASGAAAWMGFNGADAFLSLGAAALLAVPAAGALRAATRRESRGA